MPVRARASCVAGLAALTLLATVRAEEIAFPSLDGTAIKAHVFQPEQQPPRGTVVALHGCSGLYASIGARKGLLSARHQAWADLLVQDGYAVVFPDSLTPRGETELCTQRPGSRRVGQLERRADALGALAWAASQLWARADRIALLGWSHGGSAVLASTDAGSREVRGQTMRPAVAIAFYPGCSAALKSRYRASTRLVLLLGEKDDWTPAGPCLELGQAAAAEVHLYPDAHHGFDNPGGQVRLLKDVPNGVNPGQGVHVGRNPAAAQLATARVRELLRETFK